MLPLFSVLFCVSGIATSNENRRPSNVSVDYFNICGDIKSILNNSPRIPLIKVLFLVIIDALIICRNDHEKRVLFVTHSTRVRETVTSFPFTIYVVL